MNYDIFHHPTESSAKRFRRLINSQRTCICPFLGAFDDPNSHANYPSRMNRCWIDDESLPASDAQQSGFCLSTNFMACQRVLSRAGSEDHAGDPGLPPEKRRRQESLLQIASAILSLK